MSNPDTPKEDEPPVDTSPPPAYSEVCNQPVMYSEVCNQPVMYSQSAPHPPPTYPGARPFGDQGYSHTQPPYPQSFPQGYPYPPGQVPPMAGKDQGMMGAPYACGQYPPGQYPPGQFPPGQFPPGQYPPGQFPPGQPGFAHGQAYPPPVFPQGPYPVGPYPQSSYGQPTLPLQVTQPSGATRLVTHLPPPDNLTLSVLACLMCFWPTGLMAIVYSCSARAANQTNDHQAALRYGNRAKRLAIASFVIGIAIFIFSIIVRLILDTSYSTASY